MCTRVRGWVSAAAGVRPRRRGSPCPWGSDWSECGCGSECDGQRRASRRAGEQVTWPGSKGVSGCPTASPACERPWVSLVVRARRVSYGTGGSPGRLGGRGTVCTSKQTRAAALGAPTCRGQQVGRLASRGRLQAVCRVPGPCAFPPGSAGCIVRPQRKAQVRKGLVIFGPVLSNDIAGPKANNRASAGVRWSWSAPTLQSRPPLFPLAQLRLSPADLSTLGQ